jgi:hypothetical protein
METEHPLILHSSWDSFTLEMGMKDLNGGNVGDGRSQGGNGRRREGR